MNITKETVGENAALLKVEVVESDYKPTVEKTLKSYAKTANIPGFRKGHVPVQHIERIYGKTVLAEELNKVAGDAVYAYIKENNLDLLGSPLSNDEKTADIDFDTQKDFVLYFDIAIKPDIEIDLSSVKATDYKIQPDEKTLEKFEKDIRQRYGKFESPETIADKDLVYGKIEELDAEGKVKEGGVSSFTSLAVDMVEAEDIKKEFIGKKKDDAVTFNFRSAFSNVTDMAAMLRISKEEVENFDAKVLFTISGVSRMEPHELNEELFAKAFPGEGIKTEKEFKDRLHKDLGSTYEKESDRKLLNDAIDFLVKNTEIEVPKEFLKRWFFISSNGKTTPEQVEAEWDKYRDSIKWQIIEANLLRLNNVEVNRQEVVDFIKTNIASQYFPMGQTEEENKEREQRLEEVATAMLERQDQVQQIYDTILNEKLTQLFKEKATLKTKKISLDDFIKEITKA